ncbi:FAD-dependent oxidoreductase [Prosthecobacter sp.]|uniref:FAD-dependent oxidoreductase n=1 Tax=Prosthecobacter sp. TaxID=1965333 RepID=UPI0037838FE1
MKHESPWKLASVPSFPALDQDASTEALVIGGGISGVTAAYLLAQAGCSVILVEKDRLGSGQTFCTTAHISYPTDERLRDLVKTFGREHAEAVWDACKASSDQIRRNVCAESIDCDFSHVPAYLYAAEGAEKDETPALHEDASLASWMGFDARFISQCPVTHQPAVLFSNLLKFHPLKYLLALAEAAQKKGAQIHENCEAWEFDPEKRTVRCNGHTISYQHVFIATHVPLQGTAGMLSSTLLQTKLAGYTTYAMEAELPDTVVPEALWWDTADPYFYFRTDKVGDTLRIIAGGEDNKTGQEEDTDARYTALMQRVQKWFPSARFLRRWSGQVIETVDGLPYIGEYAGQFVATGFSGTGMTFGTLSGMMFAEHVQGIASPWKSLFHVERKELSSTWDYLKENKDYPYYLTKSLFMGSSRKPEELGEGHGAILRMNGKKVAAARDKQGGLTLLSAICPHMGCVVGWNHADQLWECPCHGSTFTPEGKVLTGPAETPLEPVDPDDLSPDWPPPALGM